MSAVSKWQRPSQEFSIEQDLMPGCTQGGSWRVLPACGGGRPPDVQREQFDFGPQGLTRTFQEERGSKWGAFWEEKVRKPEQEEPGAWGHRGRARGSRWGRNLGCGSFGKAPLWIGHSPAGNVARCGDLKQMQQKPTQPWKATTPQ